MTTEQDILAQQAGVLPPPEPEQAPEQAPPPTEPAPELYVPPETVYEPSPEAIAQEQELAQLPETPPPAPPAPVDTTTIQLPDGGTVEVPNDQVQDFLASAPDAVVVAPLQSPTVDTSVISLPPYYVFSDEPYDQFVKMAIAGATVAELLKYTQDHPDAVRGAYAGRLNDQIMEKIYAAYDLEGKPQFNEYKKLGLIPTDAVYVPTADGKWAYRLPSAQPQYQMPADFNLSRSELAYIRTNQPDVYKAISEQGLNTAFADYGNVLVLAKWEVDFKKSDPQLFEIYRNAGGGQKGIDATNAYITEYNARIATSSADTTWSAVDPELSKYLVKSGVAKSEGYDIARYLRDHNDDDSALVVANFTPTSIAEARTYNANPWRQTTAQDRIYLAAYRIGLDLTGQQSPEEIQSALNKDPSFLNLPPTDPKVVGLKAPMSERVFVANFVAARINQPEYSSLGSKTTVTTILSNLATGEYMRLYGKGTALASQGTDVLTVVAPAFKALHPEYTIKDVSGADWALSAANIALLVVAPILGKVAGAGVKAISGVKTAVEVGAALTYPVVTATRWSKMSTTERILNVAIDTTIAGAILGRPIVSSFRQLVPGIGFESRVEALARAARSGDATAVWVAGDRLEAYGQALEKAGVKTGVRISEQGRFVKGNADSIAKSVKPDIVADWSKGTVGSTKFANMSMTEEVNAVVKGKKPLAEIYSNTGADFNRAVQIAQGRGLNVEEVFHRGGGMPSNYVVFADTELGRTAKSFYDAAMKSLNPIYGDINMGKAFGYSNDDIAAYLRSKYTGGQVALYAPEWYRAVTGTTLQRAGALDHVINDLRAINTEMALLRQRGALALDPKTGKIYDTDTGEEMTLARQVERMRTAKQVRVGTLPITRAESEILGLTDTELEEIAKVAGNDHDLFMKLAREKSAKNAKAMDMWNKSLEESAKKYEREQAQREIGGIISGEGTEAIPVATEEGIAKSWAEHMQSWEAEKQALIEQAAREVSRERAYQIMFPSTRTTPTESGRLLPVPQQATVLGAIAYPFNPKEFPDRAREFEKTLREIQIMQGFTIEDTSAVNKALERRISELSARMTREQAIKQALQEFDSASKTGTKEETKTKLKELAEEKTKEETKTAFKTTTQTKTQTKPQTATQTKTKLQPLTEVQTQLQTLIGPKTVVRTTPITETPTPYPSYPPPIPPIFPPRPPPPPPPPPPPTKKPPTPPPIELPSVGDGAKRKSVAVGSLTWRMGMFWKYIPAPWKDNKPQTSRYAPLGANISGRTPQETLQVIGKPPARVPKSFSIDLGVVDAFITDYGKTITFAGRGTLTDVGTRIDSPTTGMSVDEGGGGGRDSEYLDEETVSVPATRRGTGGTIRKSTSRPAIIKKQPKRVKHLSEYGQMTTLKGFRVA